MAVLPSCIFEGQTFAGGGAFVVVKILMGAAPVPGLGVLGVLTRVACLMCG